MSAPESMSPLAEAWKPGRHGASGPGAVSIALHEAAIVQVTARRGEREALRARCAAVLGLELPGPGASAAARELTALAIAPDSWLLVGPRRAGIDPAEALASSLGAAGSVVDQSMGRAVLRLSGARAREVLAKGCRVDLHARSFGPGRVAVTPIGHVVVTLVQVDATPAFDLLVPASYAQAFLEWLLEAAGEHGADLAPF